MTVFVSTGSVQNFEQLKPYLYEWTFPKDNLLTHIPSNIEADISNSYKYKIKSHCVKSIQIRSYFWYVFSCIQTEYRKIRTRDNSVFGNFTQWVSDISFLIFRTIFRKNQVLTSSKFT